MLSVYLNKGDKLPYYIFIHKFEVGLKSGQEFASASLACYVFSQGHLSSRKKQGEKPLREGKERGKGRKQQRYACSLETLLLP